jgi:hypothetical protein
MANMWRDFPSRPGQKLSRAKYVVSFLSPSRQTPIVSPTLLRGQCLHAATIQAHLAVLVNSDVHYRRSGKLAAYHPVEPTCRTGGSHCHSTQHGACIFTWRDSQCRTRHRMMTKVYSFVVSLTMIQIIQLKESNDWVISDHWIVKDAKGIDGGIIWGMTVTYA